MGAGEGFQTSGVNYFSFPKSKDTREPVLIRSDARAIPFVNCHPERSEGSAVRRKMQIPRSARDDKIW
jgi:hypothetical protein